MVSDPKFDSGDVGIAIFALGRYVQVLIDEGCAPREKLVGPLMQAYLNLTAASDGREPLSLRELQDLEEAEAREIPQPQEAKFRDWPSWLSAHERFRRRFLSRATLQNTLCPRVPEQSDPSLASHSPPSVCDMESRAEG